MNYEVNLENLTPEEQEQFNTLVKKANKPKSIWMPKLGEEYFCLDTFRAKIIPMIWDRLAVGTNNGDNFCYAIGNCFKTRGEAEFALERLKVIAEMKRYITEHDDVRLNWTNEAQKKYSLMFDHYFDCVSYRGHNMYTYNTICASSGNIMEDMIKEIGEDRIKKYYFEVK